MPDSAAHPYIILNTDHPGIQARNVVIQAALGVAAGEVDMTVLDSALRDYVQVANQPVTGTVHLRG